MKIAIVSPYNPFRGGIAQFGAEFVTELRKNNDVLACNFSMLYPSILFPGTSQFVDQDEVDVEFKQNKLLNSLNPLSYYSTAKTINEFNPSVFVSCYWMSFFAPSLGIVARNLAKGTKKVGLIHNLIPHEPKFYDKTLTKFYLNQHDSFVVLSEEVKQDLIALKPTANVDVLFHPIYTQFGSLPERGVALTKFGIPNTKKVLLFFGLIRAYKGLDQLLIAMSYLPTEYHLLIAGECYGDFNFYIDLIKHYNLEERITIVNRFIPEKEVSVFFAVADLCVLPYKSATQSGVTAVAHNFGVPVLATNVGGLSESISHMQNGILVEKENPKAIAEGILLYFNNGLKVNFSENISASNSEKTWSKFATKFQLYCTEHLNK